jgi:hypothetical protein
MQVKGAVSTSKRPILEQTGNWKEKMLIWKEKYRFWNKKESPESKISSLNELFGR